MYPPKKTSKPQISDIRKERLLQLLEREELKGLLISKYRAKYGTQPALDENISEFVSTQQLTSKNLEALEQKLSKDNALRPSSKVTSPSKFSNKSELSEMSYASRLRRAGNYYSPSSSKSSSRLTENE